MAESSTITREGALMTKVPDDHPLMIAWKAYTATGDYENTKGWCVGPHAEGSLWAAFERGFMAASVMPHPNPPGGPVANPEGERIYSAIVERSRAEIPEEERGASSLEDAVRFIERWMPESLPASNTGQVPFGRALLEMALDSMKAALAMVGARDDVQCRCVSTFGANPECGACGGSGCVTAAVEAPKPGDLTFRSEWEASREISHDEAREIARRLIASHFRRTDTETARASIPANPDRDDDLLICSYIKQQARKEVAAPGDLRSTPAMRQAADEARTAWLRDVDANDQIGALTAAIEAALAAEVRHG